MGGYVEPLGRNLQIDVVAQHRHPVLSGMRRSQQIRDAHRPVPPAAGHDALRVECALSVFLSDR
jgi:hypothetical protein